jgi:hypothetical protein
MNNYYKRPSVDWDDYPTGKPDSTETYEVTSIPEQETPVNTQIQTTDPLFRAHALNQDGIRKVNAIGIAFAELHKVLINIIGIEPPSPYGINPNVVEVAQLRLRLQEAKMWATRAASVAPENQK